MKNRLYVYLAKLNKNGIKIIANFSFKSTCFPTKISINELDKLNLSNEIKNEIYHEFQKNKLIYEIYVETAESFVKLRESLIRRGYKNLPLQQSSLRLISNQTINESMLVTKKSTMLRKNTDQARVT